MGRCLLFLLGALTIQAALSAVALTNADEPQWGTLKARFVYDGPPPERAKIKLDKNTEYCGKFDPRDESLVVEPDGGLANVVLWLAAKPGEPPAAHPDFAKSADARVTLDNRDCRFEPHVLTMRTTQTLVVRNSDAIQHNAAFSPLRTTPFNVLIKPDQAFEFRLKEPEFTPRPVSCGIQPWRRGWILVLDHPYAAVSDPQGQLAIANLPVGRWTFRAFQEKLGNIKSVEMKGTSVEWPKGKFKLEIKPGENDLGEVKLSPELFQRD